MQRKVACSQKEHSSKATQSHPKYVSLHSHHRLRTMRQLSSKNNNQGVLRPWVVTKSNGGGIGAAENLEWGNSPPPKFSAIPILLHSNFVTAPTTPESSITIQ